MQEEKGREKVKRLSQFERAVVALTAAFLLFAVGYFAAARRPSDSWRVETEHAATSESQRSDRSDSGTDGLLEGEVMDLNTASRSDLERLPGIGAGRAQEIIDWRQEHGPFSSVDELDKVDGIGPGILEQIRPYVRVS